MLKWTGKIKDIREIIKDSLGRTLLALFLIWLVIYLNILPVPPRYTFAWYVIALVGVSLAQMMSNRLTYVAQILFNAALLVSIVYYMNTMSNIIVQTGYLYIVVVVLGILSSGAISRNAVEWLYIAASERCEVRSVATLNKVCLDVNEAASAARKGSEKKAKKKKD